MMRSEEICLNTDGSWDKLRGPQMCHWDTGSTEFLTGILAFLLLCLISSSTHVHLVPCFWHRTVFDHSACLYCTAEKYWRLNWQQQRKRKKGEACALFFLFVAFFSLSLSLCVCVDWPVMSLNNNKRTKTGKKIKRNWKEKNKFIRKELGVVEEGRMYYKQIKSSIETQWWK